MLTINGQRTTHIRLKQGEVKLFTFKYNVDITNATFEFGIKNDKKDYDCAIYIPDSAFDKSELNKRTVKCIVDTSKLEAGQIYFGEMKTTWYNENEVLIDKTEDIVIEVIRAVIE